MAQADRELLLQLHFLREDRGAALRDPSESSLTASSPLWYDTVVSTVAVKLVSSDWRQQSLIHPH